MAQSGPTESKTLENVVIESMKSNGNIQFGLQVPDHFSNSDFMKLDGENQSLKFNFIGQKDQCFDKSSHMSNGKISNSHLGCGFGHADSEFSEPRPVDFSLFWSDVNANTIKSNRTHLDSGFFEQASFSERFGLNPEDKFSTLDDIVSQIIDDEGSLFAYNSNSEDLQNTYGIESSPTTPSSAWSSGTDEFGQNKSASTSFSFSEVWDRSSTSDLLNLSTSYHNNNILPSVDKSYISQQPLESLPAGLQSPTVAQTEVLNSLIQDLQRTDLSSFDNLNQFLLPANRAQASSTPINGHISQESSESHQRARRSLAFEQNEPTNFAFQSFKQGSSPENLCRTFSPSCSSQGLGKSGSAFQAQARPQNVFSSSSGYCNAFSGPANSVETLKSDRLSFAACDQLSNFQTKRQRHFSSPVVSSSPQNKPAFQEFEPTAHLKNQAQELKQLAELHVATNSKMLSHPPPNHLHHDRLIHRDLTKLPLADGYLHDLLLSPLVEHTMDSVTQRDLILAEHYGNVTGAAVHSPFLKYHNVLLPHVFTPHGAFPAAEAMEYLTVDQFGRLMPTYYRPDMYFDLPHYMYGFHPLLPGFRNPLKRTGPSNELHVKLEECYEQFRNVERERKKTEAELARQNPGKRVSSMNNIVVPRLPSNPSRVDRLIVDSFKEHARIITLIDKMEKLRSITVHPNIHSAMERWLEGIRKVQARRKEEIVNATNRHRNGGPRHQEDKDVLALAASIGELSELTRRARTAQWCSLQAADKDNPSLCKLGIDVQHITACTQSVSAASSAV